MAKKDKKFVPDQEASLVDHAMASMTEGSIGPNDGTETEVKAPAVPKGFHLVCETKDVHGRTDYRFGKFSQMPKRAPRIHVEVDGEETEMAVTNSGGYAVEKGFNGYLTARGFTGWILFGHGVDPQSEEQFPEGLKFTTKDGSCEANPLREPANKETEMKRREAAAAAAKKRAEDKAAAAPATESAETTQS